MAVVSGDYEAAEKIDMPMSDDWEPGAGTIKVYPVLRGNRTVPGKYTPFQWPVLFELHRLVARYGLGSPVANLLPFLSTEEVTSFDIKQLAKLICTPIQYMLFESIWKSSAEKQELKNLRVSQEDPHFGAGVTQLLGLPPLGHPQLQAKLHSLVLAQAKTWGCKLYLK